MSKKKANERIASKRAKKVNSEPTTQSCCGAPKNGHYGDCTGKRGKK